MRRLLVAFLLGACCCDAPPPVPRGDAGAAHFRELPLDGQREAPWPDGTYFLPEIMGPGVGLVDFDADGDLDILQPTVPPPGRAHDPAPARLWRQEPGSRFVEVGAAVGFDHAGFGQGIAVGDVDGDGDPDVYLADFGSDALLINEGGRFRDATADAGIEDREWSSSAVFCDVDGDRDLDLFVVHYLVLDFEGECRSPAGLPDYCGPQKFRGLRDTLWENRGDGTFVDATERRGLVPAGGGRRAKGLGAVCVDLDGDDHADLYVANDGEPNQYWVNRGDGTFTERAVMSGVAVNRDGHPEASMGLAVGDVDADGRLDLFVTHLSLEHNRLYLRGAGRGFAERTIELGLTAFDLPYTGFGCALFDVEHDGDLDLLALNGRVRRPDSGSNDGPFWSLYAEPDLLLRFDAEEARFESAAEWGGTLTSRAEVGRGLALGDLDGDGDLDVVSSHVDNTLRIHLNDAPPEAAHWLIVDARDGSRPALGARVSLLFGAGERRVAAVLAGQSYMSSHEPVAHFGLGSRDRVDAIEVAWPGGPRERFPCESVDRRVIVRRGQGSLP